MGWGDVFGKVFDWIPGRRESYRIQIEQIKREMDTLAKKKPFDTRDSIRYGQLADRLRVLEAKVKAG